MTYASAMSHEPPMGAQLGAETDANPPQATKSERILLYGMVFFWLLNTLFRNLFTTSLDDMGDSLSETFRAINVTLEIGLALVLVFSKVGRRELPIVGFLYGICIMLLVFVREDVQLDARSSIPLGLLAFVPYWLGRTVVAQYRDHGDYFIRVGSTTIAVIFIAGTLIWVVPSGGEQLIAGLTGRGSRSVLMFNYFLGAVNVYFLTNRVVMERTRGKRIFWFAILALATFYAVIGWTRSELAPVMLILLASGGLRMRWVVPVAAALLLIAAQIPAAAETLRIGSSGDVTNGRAELQKYLWNTFEENPEIGIGRGIAGFRARTEVADKKFGGSTEHGFVMHLASNGLLGAGFLLALLGKCGWTAATADLAKGWSQRSRANKTEVATCSAFAAGLFIFGATGGLAAGSSFPDFLMLFTLGMVSKRASGLIDGQAGRALPPNAFAHHHPASAAPSNAIPPVGFVHASASSAQDRAAM